MSIWLSELVDFENNPLEEDQAKPFQFDTDY